MPGLDVVPSLVLTELGRARRGVVVLAVDGLSYRAAVRGWPTARITKLASTVPSTSATAWLTALTGVPAAEHGVPGAVYRVGGSLVYAITGEVIAGVAVDASEPVVRRAPTMFEHATCGATGAPVRCLVIGRELANLPGPWAESVLRGADPAAEPAPAAELARQAADPGLLVGGVLAGVNAVLDGAASTRTLLWVYVNLDDYVHGNGYDGAVQAALRRLDRGATGWAAAGWTVLAHSDHGQVPVDPDPALAEAWQEIDNPDDCELPGGGAGRIRWLHPHPHRCDHVRDRLAAALGDAATVTTPQRLGLPLDRTGPVVAVAASERFPIPDATLRFEHGALHPDELDVPFAAWRS